jgi:carboxymethylenebutenolidase
VDIELQSSDGTKLAGLHEKPAEPNGVGVLVLPDVRGLFPEYEEIAGRLAGEGYNAVAIDWFGRSAGASRREEGFDFLAETLNTNAEDIQLDVAAAIEYLRSPDGGACTTIFTLGFSFGGRHSLLSTTMGYDTAGAIGFYFMPSDRDRPPFMESSGRLGPTQRASEIKAPVLAIYASDDDELGIYPADIAGLHEALDAAGVENEVVTLEGVPHSFFDRGFTEYQEQRDDAWQRVLAFIERNRG